MLMLTIQSVKEKIRHNYEELQIVLTVLGDWEVTGKKGNIDKHERRNMWGKRHNFTTTKNIDAEKQMERCWC